MAPNIANSENTNKSASESASESEKPGHRPPLPQIESPSATSTSHRLPPKLVTHPVEPTIAQPATASPIPPKSKPSAQSNQPSAPVTAAPASPTVPTVQPHPIRSKTVAPQAFSVQVGIFANYENAKSLAERLNENGVNAHIESRVQVGPFKNKAEADETMRKLKAMGIHSVLVSIGNTNN
ncbi:SPOR domain-containing protein [Chitinivorax sp. B]|uniref:SPOR domain-containing protein n=1 Tax=Chitinivorax sp. B TaxID=2502235 RepID=UPI00148504B9|nr:SPOR domain-containing protein [Chitinivorax sp. B]